jgi:hypothetical protein
VLIVIEARSWEREMTTSVPAPIAAYQSAINTADSKAVLACFLDDAIVIDVEREFHGIPAIKAWSDLEVLNDNVTIEIREVREHYGDYIVVTKVDGDFDKTNLPDPLLITMHFILRDHRIAKIICLQMKPAGASLEDALAANAGKGAA